MRENADIQCVENLIEENAKCRQLKKLTCKRDFEAGVYLSAAQNPIPPLTPYTLYSAGIFKQSMGAIGTRQEQGCRTSPLG
jgi:hypothetical protein